MTSIALSSLDPVERLLIGLCRRDAGAAVSPADLEQLSRRSFRNNLSFLAARHRVAGLVLVALQKHPRWGELPKAVAEDLLRPYSAGESAEPGSSRAYLPLPGEKLHSFEGLVWRAHAKDQELERLLALLHAAQLEAVVLKGPALRRTVYALSVERLFGDFDLLFPVAQVDHAIDVVSAAGYAFPFSPEKLKGYRELHFHVLLRQVRRYRAEIHWGLSRPTSPFQLDPAAFLRDAVPATCAQGTPMRIPRPEHLLLHMAHENARDWFARFSRIVDLDRIVAATPDLDWDTVASQAHAGGLQSLLALSLALSRDLLATPVAFDVLASLRPGAATRLHLGLMRPAESLMRQGFSGVGSSGSLKFWLSAGACRRGRMLVHMLRGRESSDDWIFRESDQAPPHAYAALLAGLKSGLRFVGHHASLYWRGLLALTPRRRRER